jgi:3-hydroxyacyl-[acyl-carrier-protein] dehydratase
MRWFWIDRFLEFESGRYAKAIKCVSLAEDYLHDHFPQFPVFPSSLVIEGLAQTGGLLVCEHNQFTEKVILAKISKVEFFCHARPGDTLTYLATIESENTEGATITATSHIGDRLQARAEILFHHLNAPWLGTFFSPEAFLSMMRVFGAYRVGHAADGSPLTPPARLCKATRQCSDRHPADSLEGVKP